MTTFLFLLFNGEIKLAFAFVNIMYMQKYCFNA